MTLMNEPPATEEPNYEYYFSINVEVDSVDQRRNVVISKIEKTLGEVCHFSNPGVNPLYGGGKGRGIRVVRRRCFRRKVVVVLK